MDGGSFTDDSHSQAAKSTDSRRETTSTTVGRTRHPCWVDMDVGLNSVQIMHLKKIKLHFAGTPTNSRFSRNFEICQKMLQNVDLIKKVAGPRAPVCASDGIVVDSQTMAAFCKGPVTPKFRKRIQE